MNVENLEEQSFGVIDSSAVQTTLPAWSAIRWVAGVTFALLLLTACGGDPEPTPTATAIPPTPSATATAAPIEAIPTAATTIMPTLPAATSQTTEPAATQAISEPAVIEEGDCPVEYDLDLAGYPDLSQKMGCALSKAVYDPVAINEFGKGPDYNRFMLWFSTDKQIYVLFPDQTWQSYLDTWAEGQSEFTCNPLNVPPTSPPLPRRGFGKLWCTVDGMQDKMGTIDREERLCQHTVVQRFEEGSLLACFEDATIRYFRLLDDGSWDMVMVR